MTDWRLELRDFGGHAPESGVSPRPLGAAAQVRDAIDAALVDVEWGSGKGALVDGDATLEFDLGDDAPLTRILANVSGPHPRILRPLVVHLCRVNGWTARDVASGRFLDLEADLDESLD